MGDPFHEYNYPGCRPWNSTNVVDQYPDFDYTRPPNYFYYYMQTSARYSDPSFIFHLFPECEVEKCRTNRVFQQNHMLRCDPVLQEANGQIQNKRIINISMSKTILSFCLVIHALFALSVRASGEDINDDWSRVPLPTKQSFLGSLTNDTEVNILIHTVKTNHLFFGTLVRNRTEKARAALLRIAYGELGDNWNISGAECYVKSLDDDCMASALLLSDNAKICDIGLRRLMGCPVDGELFALLKRCLTSDSSYTRFDAARIMGRIKQQAMTQPVARLVVESMKTTLSTKDSKMEITFGNTVYLNQWLSGEYSLSEQAEVLAQLTGMTSEALQALAPKEDGLARDFIILSRAFLRDAAVKNEVKRLLAESKCERLRMTAIKAFSYLAIRDDIPFLKTIQETDALHRDIIGVYPAADATDLKGEPVIYPVRNAARDIIKKLQEAK